MPVRPSGLNEMLAGTYPPNVWSYSEKLVPASRRVSIGSLNCTVTTALTGTFVAPYCTLVATTDGGVVSGPSAVVNDAVRGTTTLPDGSVTPATATVITVPSGSGTCGVIVTVW